MEGSFRALVNILLRNRLATLGFLLIGASSAMYVYVQVKLLRSRHISLYRSFKYTLGWFGRDAPPNYFEIGRKHGWSPWPAFLMWPCFFVGLILLLIAFLVFKVFGDIDEPLPNGVTMSYSYDNGSE
jgi:hypothetical protein